MTNSIRRGAFTVAGLALLFVAGCGGSAEKKMQGEYTPEGGKKDATLSVTADQMAINAGPITITMNYKVVKTDGNKVTVAITGKNMSGEEKTGESVVTVGDDSLQFEGGGQPFKGKWKRK